MLGSTLFLSLCLLSADADASGGLEVLRLQSGHTIRGEVLKEKDDALVVDVGVDVLQIPKKAIVERKKGGDATAAAASNGSANGDHRYGESGSLYATADLPISTVDSLVKKLGESVVLVKTSSGLGSGFFVDDKGHCVTNFHVIERETRISVNIFLQKDNSIEEHSISDVEIVAISPFFDLALLKVPPKKGVPFKRTYFGFSNEVHEGEAVFAIGSPLGLSRSVSAGIIGNKNRNVGGQLYIQTTTQINPGNSGGPLFNLRGQVIGVTNMKITGVAEGLGFAIPINYVKDFLTDREAYAYNKDNPNTGYHYLPPPRRLNPDPNKAGAIEPQADVRKSDKADASKSDDDDDDND